MDRNLIDAIIHGANLATADSFAGQKMALKDNAMQVFKLMMDQNKNDHPPEGVVMGCECECGNLKWPDTQYCDRCQDDRNAAADAYDQMQLARGL